MNSYLCLQSRDFSLSPQLGLFSSRLRNQKPTTQQSRRFTSLMEDTEFKEKSIIRRFFGKFVARSLKILMLLFNIVIRKATFKGKTIKNDEDNSNGQIRDTISKDSETTTFLKLDEDTDREEIIPFDVASSSITDFVRGSVKNDEHASSNLPKGERWGIAATGVDLTGKWKIIVTDDFKVKYDKYLLNLGQPALVRKVAVSIVEMTIENITQLDNGRELYIKGKNLRGIWERSLIASGSDNKNTFTGKEHLKTEIVTADSENLMAEAWWDRNGSVHNSWIRDTKKYGGGDFESKRYLVDDGNILMCESKFHPNKPGQEMAEIAWKFDRV